MNLEREEKGNKNKKKGSCSNVLDALSLSRAREKERERVRFEARARRNASPLVHTPITNTSLHPTLPTPLSCVSLSRYRHSRVQMHPSSPPVASQDEAIPSSNFFTHRFDAKARARERPTSSSRIRLRSRSYVSFRRARFPFEGRFDSRSSLEEEESRRWMKRRRRA